jgi:predicted  nucleic acid-binding Zn-ribbon protein
MENAIEKKLNTLLDLQAIDCQLDDFTKMRGELPEEVEYLKAELAGLQTNAHNIQEDTSSLEQSIATQRVSIKAIAALVKKYEEQQMNVRNNREYGAITKEIDLQKLETQLAEKKIKNDYERIEEKKLALVQSQALIEKNQKVLADKQEELQLLMGESQGEEQKLHEQRTKITKKVDEDLLRAYSRIRENVHNKLAVVVVKREACGGCFNKVPPQKQADIKEKKSIVTCEHCGRIIADVIRLPEEE